MADPIIDLPGVRRVLENTQSFTITLLTLLLDQYGQDLLDWADSTIGLEARDDFSAQIPPINQAKIRSGIGIITTNNFYARPFWFVQITGALTGQGLDPSVFRPVGLDDCAWAIVEARLIYEDIPDEDESEGATEGASEGATEPPDWHPDILAYMAKVADDEGLETLPTILAELLKPYRQELQNYDEYQVLNPDIFAAEFATQMARGQEIDQMVMGRLARLRQQLSELPLTQLDVSPLLARIDQEAASLKAQELQAQQIG